MPMYDITATGRYQCQGDGGRYLAAVDFSETVQFELSSPDDDIGDELYAVLAGILPVNCRVLSGLSVLRAPSAYGPGVDAGLGESPPDDRPTGTPGQLVTIYAAVALEYIDTGEVYYRTIRTDVLWDATVDEVIEVLFAAADTMVNYLPAAYPYNILGITITAPAYFQYLTVQ